MPKQESTVYTVEREFLSNISVEELLRRIFMSQISSDTEGEGEQHGSGRHDMEKRTVHYR